MCGVSFGLLCLTSCTLPPESGSHFPPGDFRLNLEYRVIQDAKTFVKRRATIDAQGLVIVREADTALHSDDGTLSLPVFSRLCVYRLHPRSIRKLARWLGQENVKSLAVSADSQTSGEGSSEVELGLVYSSKVVTVVTRGAAFGQLRRVLRVVNSFLPDVAGFPNGDGESDRAASQVQDVPSLLDSLPESLAYHRQSLEDGPVASDWQLETFALACANRDWSFAQQVLSGMSELSDADRARYQGILVAARSANQ